MSELLSCDIFHNLSIVTYLYTFSAVTAYFEKSSFFNFYFNINIATRLTGNTNITILINRQGAHHGIERPDEQRDWSLPLPAEAGDSAVLQERRQQQRNQVRVPPLLTHYYFQTQPLENTLIHTSPTLPLLTLK